LEIAAAISHIPTAATTTEYIFKSRRLRDTRAEGTVKHLPGPLVKWYGDYALVGKHTIPLNIGRRAPINRNVPAPDKHSLLSHAIFAVNIAERLNMFWRKVRAQ
jgi:hypothetical protein